MKILVVDDQTTMVPLQWIVKDLKGYLAEDFSFTVIPANIKGVLNVTEYDFLIVNVSQGRTDIVHKAEYVGIPVIIMIEVGSMFRDELRDVNSKMMVVDKLDLFDFNRFKECFAVCVERCARKRISLPVAA